MWRSEFGKPDPPGRQSRRTQGAASVLFGEGKIRAQFRTDEGTRRAVRIVAAQVAPLAAVVTPLCQYLFECPSSHRVDRLSLLHRRLSQVGRFEITAGQIAIDGKGLRGSRSGDFSHVHAVSA